MTGSGCIIVPPMSRLGEFSLNIYPPFYYLFKRVLAYIHMCMFLLETTYPAAALYCILNFEKEFRTDRC